MARKKQDIPSGETKEEKFRRVVEPRVKKTLRAIDQLAGMPLQPSYDITENDAKRVLAIITKSYDVLHDNFQKAIDGTLKAKEIKKYTAIDWDKELEDTDNEHTEG